MLYFVVGIIIAIIIVFSIFIERALRRQDYVATVLFIALFLCCMVIFGALVHEGFNKKDDESIVIENVKEIHQIDTVTVISGKDTTRTYSITFSR